MGGRWEEIRLWKRGLSGAWGLVYVCHAGEVADALGDLETIGNMP